MNNLKNEFIRLAVIELKEYSEIEHILKVDRKTLSKLWDENKKEREYLSNLRRIWKSKFENTETTESFWIFKKWFEETEKKCKYCQISEDKINELYDKYGELTKRNRGKKLETDRKKPNEKYENIDNLVFSCYWCNNAKTDTFTHDEFLSIGKEIEIIWKKRLEK